MMAKKVSRLTFDEVGRFQRYWMLLFQLSQGPSLLLWEIAFPILLRKHPPSAVSLGHCVGFVVMMSSKKSIPHPGVISGTALFFKSAVTVSVMHT